MYSLHNHTAAGSNTRLLDSINKVEDLIQYAYDLGLEGIAITDHESVKAVPEAQKFYEAKKKEEPNSRWQDFKLIMGNEIYLCRNGLTSETYDSKKDKFYHFILLALDEVGHEQIRKLSTRAYGRSWMKMMRRVPTWYKDLEEIVKPNPGHIIASSACLGSFIDQTLLKNSQYEGRNEEAFEAGKARIEKWIYFIQSIFGKENFFLELQPSFNQEQVYVNNKLIELSRKYSIPAIVTTDSHYLRAEDRKIHKAYLNSKEGDREVDEFYATTYVMSEEEIHSYMDENLGREVVDEIISNTKLIGTRAKNWVLKNHFKLPYLPSQEDIELAKDKTFDFPATVNLNWDIWNNFINSKEDSDRVFIKRIISRCNENPSFFWTKERIERMEIELDTVWKASVKQEMTWSKYFLQVADYIQIAWTEGDTLVGPGRGSGVGFYLNYLLDIIQIDPLREKVRTLFWRFINPERASILDIDQDVQSNRRNKVIEALQNRYGKDRVVRVSTERTEGSKASILTAARGLEIDVDTAQYIASLIESDRGLQRTLSQTYYGDEEKGFKPNPTFVEEMNKYPELWEVSQKIEGLPCGVGCHAGGVIIVDEDFTKGNSMIKLNSGEWVSAFDLHESEEAGGQVKIDLLATDNLTRMRACLDLLVQYKYIEAGETLRDTYEKAIGVYNLDRENPKMWDLLAEGKIVNCFQFETAQGAQGISLSRPNSVEDLAALNSIMRLMAPEGQEQPLEKYARFKKDPTAWDKEMDKWGLTKKEKDILHKALDYEYGICASQEDGMSLVQLPELGGHSLAWGDKLRKSIAKKNPKLYKELTEEFYKVVEEKHLSKNFCDYFWKVLIEYQHG